MSVFKKAERKKVWLKLLVSGPSGSGKTYSSLLLAKGLAQGGKIAVIDTENGSASLYSHLFDFDTIEMSPPFSVKNYSDNLAAAVRENYSVVIIDSISQEWEGEGGVYTEKVKQDYRGGNSFTNWAKFTPEHEKFKTAITHSAIHVIATVRSKQQYALSENEKGKQAPKKMGMGLVQRDGIEYEFTTQFDVAMDHSAQVSKDRTGIFSDHIFTISEDTGLKIVDWLKSGGGELINPIVELRPKIDELLKQIKDNVKRADAAKYIEENKENFETLKKCELHLQTIIKNQDGAGGGK